MRKFNFHMQVVNPNPRLSQTTHVQIQHVVGQRAFSDAVRQQLATVHGVTYGTAHPQVAVTGARFQTISREAISPATRLATASASSVHELFHMTPPAVAAAKLPAARNQFFLQVDAKHSTPLAFSSILPHSVAIAAAGVGKGNLLNFKQAEGQKATMEVDIQLPAQAKPGDMHAFDLTQHSAEGDVLGGARIVLIVT
jgi:hypothetical protein